MKKSIRRRPALSTAAVLYNEQFAEPEHVVDGLLHAGHLTLVAGKPKSHKTWLTFQLAIAVATGRTFLGRSNVSSGRVLFCEFDDQPEQLRKRLHFLLPKMGAADRHALENISLIYSLKPLRGGGLRQLEEYLREAHKQGQPFKLLILDPYISLRSRRKRADWVTDDYREMAALQQLCARYGCAILLVHHLHKARSPYASDQVLGTTGLTAGVDAWWIIVSDPVDPAHRLMEVKGRSIPETMLRIGFSPDGTSPGVYVVDEGVDLKAGPEAREILLLLKREGPKTPAEIAKALHRSANSIYQLLSRLRKRDLVLKDRGKYRYQS